MIFLASILAAIGLSIGSTNQYRYVTFPANELDFSGAAFVVGDGGQTKLRAEDAAFLAEAVNERYHALARTLIPSRTSFSLGPALTLNSIGSRFDALFGDVSQFQFRYLANGDHKDELTQCGGGSLGHVITATMTNSPSPSFGPVNVFTNGGIVALADMNRIYGYLPMLKILALESEQTKPRSSGYSGTRRTINEWESSVESYNANLNVYTYSEPVSTDNTVSVPASWSSMFFSKSATANKEICRGLRIDGETMENPTSVRTVYDEENQTMLYGTRCIVEIPQGVFSNCSAIVSGSAFVAVVFDFTHSVNGEENVYRCVKSYSANVMGKNLMYDAILLSEIADECMELFGVTYKSGPQLAGSLQNPTTPTRGSSFDSSRNVYYERTSGSNSITVAPAGYVYIFLEPQFRANTSNQ